MKYQNAHTAQRGAVLVVSLILLLVMTILAIAASQGTRMQERMSGNMRDSDLAFQAAEAALRESENFIAQKGSRPAECPTLAPPCDVFEGDILPGDLRYKDATWWNDNGRQLNAPDAATTVPKQIANVSKDPRSVIEYMGAIPDSLKIGSTGTPVVRVFYRHTAHGSGGTAAAEAVVESTFTRRY